MSKTITIENLDIEKWAKFKSFCALENITLQQGFNKMLTEYLEKKTK